MDFKWSGPFKCGMTMVELLWLQQSLINCTSWNSIAFLGQRGEQTSINCAEATWNYKVREA